MMAQIPLERSPRFASTSRGCLSKLPAKPDLPSAKPRQSGMWPGVAGALVSKKACRHDARFSPFRYRQMIGRMQMTSKRVMRCFRHSPYRGGRVSEFCAVLAIKGNCPSRRVEYINPTRTLDIRRNSITTLSSRLDNSHNRSSSCSSKLITNTHKPPPKTQTLFNNVVLSIPEGRDQADSGRMLVSPGRSSDPLIILIDFHG